MGYAYRDDCARCKRTSLLTPPKHGGYCEECVQKLGFRLGLALESQWVRGSFLSIWIGPDVELIVLQSSGASESWSWTARGWREPDDDWGADKFGWAETSTREAAENAALQFYLEKDS